MEDLSFADIRAAVGDGDFGGNGWVMIILFALIFGGGGFFGNRDGFGQYATAASQTEILLGQQFQNLDNKIDRIGNGIADATFALNNSIKDCCCEQRANTDSVRYDMANFACSINQNIDNKFAALEKNQMQAQIDAQAQQLNQLYMAQQLAGVVRYPQATCYSSGSNPFCNCGCGCGTNI